MSTRAWYLSSNNRYKSPNTYVYSLHRNQLQPVNVMPLTIIGPIEQTATRSVFPANPRRPPGSKPDWSHLHLQFYALCKFIYIIWSRYRSQCRATLESTGPTHRLTGGAFVTGRCRAKYDGCLVTHVCASSCVLLDRCSVKDRWHIVVPLVMFFLSIICYFLSLLDLQSCPVSVFLNTVPSSYC